jgi:uncharacterized protein YlaI
MMEKHSSESVKPNFVCPMCHEKVAKDSIRFHAMKHQHYPETIEEAKIRFSQIGYWEEVD